MSTYHIPGHQIGKTIHARTYVHTSALGLLDAELQTLIRRAFDMVGVGQHEYNVVRYDASNQTVALLYYADFYEAAFPSLVHGWKVQLADQRVTYRTYAESLNPPILHRKELLLTPEDPRTEQYRRLTADLEALAVFDDPVRIGFRVQWTKLLAEKGYRVIDHDLVPIGNDESLGSDEVPFDSVVGVPRHLTALARSNFSAPVQLLNRFGLLDQTATVFDYGCGRGDDLKSLIANGIPAAGWDPYYAPEAPIAPADIVNLGFVINVIEDPVERREALQRAYSLATKVLAVSTMIASEGAPRGRAFADGILTGRNTFQKYYTQTELRDYLIQTLGETPIPVAPGIFFIFRDKAAEQRFESTRMRSRIRLTPLARPPRPPVSPSVRVTKPPRPDKYELYRELLDPLWLQCLHRGRQPDRSEVTDIEKIEAELGSFRKALDLTLSRHDLSALDSAKRQRTDDLLVLLALQLFQKRRPYKQLEPSLQLDIKHFFGDYTSAVALAQQLLYKVANAEILNDACERAAEAGLGLLDPSQSLQLHSTLVPRLLPVLRVYVGSAAILYGDVSQADLVKLHIRSSKVSFMKFDDFDNSAMPRMIERAKVNLRSQHLDLFEYGEAFPPPYLYFKSRFLNEEHPHYAAQLAFEEQLRSLNLFDFAAFGPAPTAFDAALSRARWKIDGYKLLRHHYVPDLDAACGHYLTYRQLIECGETQQVLGIPNMPKSPESFTALYDLATKILDPVIEYFGGVDLTYGFCSLALGRKIHGRIAPELDQHAAHETKRSGELVCKRQGAAVDFLVRDEDMRDVAEWIIANLPYDRLYYYGRDRPLHVSYGPEETREAVEMILLPTGRRVPRRFTPYFKA